MARLEVGRVARPHGLAGEVVVALSTNRTERVEPGAQLWAGERILRVVRSSPHQDRWVVAFEGVTDRTGAEALRGQLLFAPPLEDPEALWVHQLIGCRLLDQEGGDRGEIVAVQANPASDLLVLDDGGLVPLRFVTARRAGAVEADLPAGLLE